MKQMIRQHNSLIFSHIIKIWDNVNSVNAVNFDWQTMSKLCQLILIILYVGTMMNCSN